MSPRRAVVLAGGSFAASAWESGLGPDKASEDAIASGSLGSPAIRTPTAKAAYEQGKRFVAEGGLLRRS